MGDEASTARPQAVRSRGRWWEIALWVVARGDDFLAALCFGALASLVHPERYSYRQLVGILDDGDDPDDIEAGIPHSSARALPPLVP